MKNLLLYLLFTCCITANSFAQELILQQDFPGLTWPFLWDIEQDEQGNLYTCSEQGILFIKTDGIWSEYDLNSSSFADARGIAIDQDGIVWISTTEGLYSFANGSVLNHYTAENSDLPSNDLREIRAYEDQLWIVLNGNGLALKTGENFSHQTESNSSLESNFVDDIEVTSSGTLIIGANEHVQFLKGNDWQTSDFNDMFGFQTWVNDIYIDDNQDVWFATDKGIIKYLNSNDSFENLKPTYGENNYSAIIFTPEKELWMCELFEGLHYYDDLDNNFFFPGDLDGRPTQVFDFEYYQDTVRIVGNIGSTVTGITVDLDTSTDDLFQNNQTILSVFPNPTHSIVNLQFKKSNSYKVSVKGLNGQTLITSFNTPNIDFSSFDDGHYIIEIKDMVSQQILRKMVQVVK